MADTPAALILVSFDIDGTLDEYYARLAGFDFRYADQLPGPPESWLIS